VSGVRRMAAVQKENLRVILEDQGSAFSAFRILPRYKFRTEGDCVYAADQILLESVEIAGHTVGGSTEPYMPGLNEANLSETDSGWTIDEYCRLLPSDAGYIKVGNQMPLRFYHPEAKALLTASTSPSKGKNPPYLRRMINQDTSDTLNHSAKSVWYFEFLKATQGGVAYWESVMRIRHLATGKYLAVNPQIEWVGDLAQFQATMIDPKDSPSRAEWRMTEFQFQAIAMQTTKQIVLDDCSVRIMHKFATPISGKARRSTRAGSTTPRRTRPTWRRARTSRSRCRQATPWSSPPPTTPRTRST
jgi:hypothetical protein